MMVKYHLSQSGRRRVPRPMICLNSLMELMTLSSTIRRQVLQSTPVVIRREVVTMTGYLLFTLVKLSSCFLPTALSPVMRIT